MMLLTHLPRLLAQAATTDAGGAPPRIDRLAEISNNLSSDSLVSSHWLFIAAGIVFVLLSTISIVQWWKHRHDHSHPWLIFMATARIAGLSFRDQWALLRISHHQKLDSPLTLMLSPGTFDYHVKAYLDTRPNWRREGRRRRSQSIREQLFGDLGVQGFAPEPNRHVA